MSVKKIHILKFFSEIEQGDFNNLSLCGGFLPLALSTKKFPEKMIGKCAARLPRLPKKLPIGSVLDLCIGDPFVLEECKLVAKKRKKDIPFPPWLKKHLSTYPGEIWWTFKRNDGSWLFVDFDHVADARHFRKRR